MQRTYITAYSIGGGNQRAGPGERAGVTKTTSASDGNSKERRQTSKEQIPRARLPTDSGIKPITCGKEHNRGMGGVMGNSIEMSRWVTGPFVIHLNTSDNNSRGGP